MKWRWKQGVEVSHHLLMLTLLATLNALNTLLEMLDCSLLLIHMFLYTLNSLLEVLKSRSEVSLMLIYVLLHRIKTSVMD